MSNYTSSINRASKIADSASSKASDAFNSVSEKASDALNSVSDKATDAFNSASEKATDAYNATVDYVRSNSASEMWDDVQDFVKAHPAQALIAAAAAGFIVAGTTRRS